MNATGAVVFLPREGNGVSLMLEDLLFDPAALWLAQALSRAGVERFFVVCHTDDREKAQACFPEGTEFVTGVTDVVTGRPVYFGKQPLMADQCRLLRASAAIPLFSPMVEFRGRLYLDGGTADPIPVKRALADGCDKVLVVLTQHREYVKSPTGQPSLYRRAFRDYPQMIRVLDERHTLYNDTRAWLWELEKTGKAVVVAPSSPLTVSRFEKRRSRLDEAYFLGKRDVLLSWDALRPFLSSHLPAE